ncbi:GNAT family N-acetyltransferase [Actinoplanes sp. NBRC 103695]|uniref:GNAT family N-acetyltransferase n=1 Tax=Actinoplanes sp. NBRC 103695 TaxID=3032202 RepID=UPI002556A917|nr:GNAT family N-acetyltransferase [Actinoplanes sp. NBRC 103695]
MDDVSIRFLEGESDMGTLRRLYDSVIAPSFLPAEREPLEKLTRVLAADELRGAIAVTSDGEPVGALFLEWFADIRAALLCYFAIRPDLRGQGIGRRLVAEAAPRWRSDLKPHVVFAEAEDPRAFDAGPAAGHAATGDDAGAGVVDYGDGDARLRLYAGFGARRLPIPYLMPELAPGAGRLPGLLLLVVEADDIVSPSPDRIESTIVADFLIRYFARQEGDAARDDGQLRQLLDECRRTASLELHGL